MPILQVRVGFAQRAIEQRLWRSGARVARPDANGNGLASSALSGLAFRVVYWIRAIIARKGRAALGINALLGPIDTVHSFYVYGLRLCMRASGLLLFMA